MKAAPLLVSWHNDNAAIYSAHFEPHGKGRLATAGGDNNVRLWKIEGSGEDRKVNYLSTLVKHTQAVNVVRWCPRGELLGSAGDDGNVLLWVPSEVQTSGTFGEEGLEDKETWRVKHMCRSLGSEIYDLAWSPDGSFFITGSMDNIARIYNSQNGQVVRQIAEHSHYVQGVAWDPLNEFVATQSSDRSVHIYTLKTKDGQFSLAQHNKVTKMDLPARRISSSSPAPPDFGSRASFVADTPNPTASSPGPSAPGTPASLALPMNPPTSHSRRSSFGSSRRSASPAPSSMPLPAVMPSTSPNIHAGLSVRNANIYANETLTSFFRRLTFAPDGSLLFTPAGQYKTSHPSSSDAAKTSDDIINTVYIYTRAGLNKPPIAYLPGHKKPSVAVKCSPVYYTLRESPPPTKHITIDTSSAEDEIPALPEPVMQQSKALSTSSMDPPPFTSVPSPSPSAAAASPRPDSSSGAAASPVPAGPTAAFSLPYRMIYAVATQDAVHIYDTQQQKPLCIVSNLHFATFTDLTWTNDGHTLLMTSSDGFCSCLTFQPGELGQVHPGPAKHQQPTSINIAAATSNQSTPTPTPTQATVPMAKQPSQSGTTFPASPASFAPARPASPARSMSCSSIATQSSFAPGPDPNVALSNQTPSISAVPGVAAANPSGSMPMWTPPHTPMPGTANASAANSVSGSSVAPPPPAAAPAAPAARKEGTEDKAEDDSSRNLKREGDTESASDKQPEPKKRRIAPTLVSRPAQDGAGSGGGDINGGGSSAAPSA
ncbi:chromatin assembly factor 1 protein [Phyllosticta citrichinensis]|uniref:Chromatin assembly factor 1 protein n=1 Tax=Phyllosticta citrichinensis TaxID=1130410 RepID=A0ABR1Y041_9PEZI